MNQGILYEQFVKSCIIENSNFTLLGSKGGNFNCHETDIYLEHGNGTVGIEVKKSGAQMGETSFRFDPDSGFFPVKDIAPDLTEMIESALWEMRSDMLTLLDFLRKQKPINYHGNHCIGFPCQVTKAAWDAARTSGLLVPINRKLQYTEKAITDHYNNKGAGVYYMQIEKAGLFYLGKNPIGWPIPPMKANINIEIRLKRSGSKYNAMVGEKTAGVSLIAVGRMQQALKSPISLDDDTISLLV